MSRECCATLRRCTKDTTAPKVNIQHIYPSDLSITVEVSPELGVTWAVLRSGIGIPASDHEVLSKYSKRGLLSQEASVDSHRLSPQA